MRRTAPAPDRRLDVDRYTPEMLHTMLVEDAVLRHPTSLMWAIAAYERIADLTDSTPEEAYQAVRNDLRSRVGLPIMPLG